MADKVSYTAVDYVAGAFMLIVPMGIGIWYALRDADKATRDEYRSEVVRLFGTFIGLLTTIFYQSIVMLSPALALQATADMPLWMSLALIGCIGTIYTAIGGFKSVIWTDVFQAVMVFVGIIAIVTKACVEVGGIGEVWRLSEEGGRTKMDKFSFDPRVRHTVWSQLIGFCLMMSTNCYAQATIQRISSMKSVGDAKVAFLLNVPFHLFYGCVNALVGLSIYAYYSHHKCDPLEAGLITNKNQLAPYFVLHAMTSIPGMAGLYLGVLCCGSLSSLSSGINAMAANTIQDILPSLLKSASEATITFVTKLLVVLYGSLAIGLAYLAQSMDGPVIQLAVAMFGAFGAPLLGIIVMGAAVPWANKFGALAGVVVSLPLNLWIAFGSVIQAAPLKTLPPITTENCFKPADMLNSSSYNALVTKETLRSVYRNVSGYSDHFGLMNHTEPSTDNSVDTFFMYDISYEWYTPIGFVCCIIVGLFVSFLTNPRPYGAGLYNRGTVSAYTDAKYIFPFLRGFWKMDDEENFDSIEKTGSSLTTGVKNGHLDIENLSPLLTEYQSNPTDKQKI
ncbi:sodium-coupled monocarboxylate transporter 1 [Plakobranchus ocellatus]|uniref:Sodium-coupled monocarboxylate transporter 1 n=1 Tax=Plakobranchus ocellatus TaxID=259542 RepID=A0AAV4DLD4_9GAST|nr:sodium-coupled monocarboxylate transporter 1 [Plakobranchus ocellatus]